MHSSNLSTWAYIRRSFLFEVTIQLTSGWATFKGWPTFRAVLNIVKFSYHLQSMTPQNLQSMIIIYAATADNLIQYPHSLCALIIINIFRFMCIISLIHSNSQNKNRIDVLRKELPSITDPYWQINKLNKLSEIQTFFLYRTCFTVTSEFGEFFCVTIPSLSSMYLQLFGRSTNQKANVLQISFVFYVTKQPKIC